jgi:hypothetical protein
LEAILDLDFIKNWDNIALAGGYIFNTIVGDQKAREKGDIDLFFYFEKSMSIEVIESKIKLKMLNVLCWLHETYPNAKLTLDKSYTGNNEITVQKTPESSIKIQFVNRIYYHSIKEMIDSFDINCVKFAWDGFRLHSCDESIEFLKTNQLIAHHDVIHSRIYDQRLLKYSNRGYEIVEMSSTPEIRRQRKYIHQIYQKVYTNRAHTKTRDKNVLSLDVWFDIPLVLLVDISEQSLDESNNAMKKVENFNKVKAWSKHNRMEKVISEMSYDTVATLEGMIGNIIFG